MSQVVVFPAFIGPDSGVGLDLPHTVHCIQGCFQRIETFLPFAFPFRVSVLASHVIS